MRSWTAAQLKEIQRRWEKETLPEIAEDLGVPSGTLRSLLHRHGIKCPAPNPKSRRRKFGPISGAEKDRRRRWYRMYHRLRLDGVPAQEAVRQLQAQGCDLTRHQMTCGWWHYKKTLERKR